MYREYFGLKDNPFSISPDPHYFYMSAGHQEALAHLQYGISSDGGFILLTGEVGTGKTTVCRCLLEMLPENTDIAFILNPNLTVEELLATICDEFGIKYPEGNRSNKVFVSAINDYLLEAHTKGRRTIVIIEEAQNLSIEVLEQIRLLTNLETNKRKLLQIIMLGQPELRELLSQTQLRQLSQRITARYHLGPLSEDEVAAYVARRLSIAGLVRANPFSRKVLKTLYRLTKGVPRLINVICDRALMGAFVQEKERVDKETLITAAREVSGEEERSWRRSKKGRRIAAISALVLLCVGVLFVLGKEIRKVGYTVEGSSTKAVVEMKKFLPSATPGLNLDRPAGTSDGDMRNSAYQELFNTWGLKYDPRGRPVCEQAGMQGVQCLHDKGGLVNLRQLNKPALLKFVDGKKGEYYAILKTLDGDLATLTVGSDTGVADVKEIGRRWTGEYLLFWRAPPGFKRKLRQGSQGPFVAWLNEQLALSRGQQASESERQSAYNENTIRQLKGFQASAGLTPDGIAGIKTIICLSNAAGTGGPVLREEKEGGDKHVLHP